jgi:hypothetical protein
MDNEQTKSYLLKWCDKPDWNHFSWPTDGCGYDQHIRFVEHRNKNWHGETTPEFIEFVRQYANSL